MNKRIFTLLIVFMGISILGIIAVQLVWMNNAVRVKNETFNRSVNQALVQTVNRLEDIHNLGVVNEMIFEGDSAHWLHEDEDFDMDFDFEMDNEMKWHRDHDSIHFISRKAQKSKKPVRIIRQFAPGNEEATIEIKVETDSNSEKIQSFAYNINTTTKANNHVVLSGDEVKANGIVLIKKDTVITDIDSIYSYTTVKIDSVLTDLEEFEVVRPELSRRVQLKATNLKRLANKVVTEVTAWDVSRIDEDLVFEVLQNELFENNILLDFEYGIERGDILEFPVPVEDSVAVANTMFKTDLYPNDIFQKDIKLAVFFPKKDSSIYRSLSWLLVASFIFSLCILMAFALSIFYIMRQKKISEMKSDFINNMTHEFKTPIATISVATDSITNKKVLGDPDRIKYFAGMIKKENTRMNHQVEDILTIARLDRKDFEFNWEAINVHELIEDAIQGIILQVEKRGGIIDVDLAASNSMITTDRIHCTNMIYNLIDNANKYSSNKPEIRISTSNVQKGILISVSDKGIGMSKAVQTKIFERFYRQTSGNIHNVKGFGLGLSYVKAVMEANKGSISVQSEQGKGSNFDVFLPFIRE